MSEIIEGISRVATRVSRGKEYRQFYQERWPDFFENLPGNESRGGGDHRIKQIDSLSGFRAPQFLEEVLNYPKVVDEERRSLPQLKAVFSPGEKRWSLSLQFCESLNYVLKFSGRLGDKNDLKLIIGDPLEAMFELIDNMRDGLLLGEEQTKIARSFNQRPEKERLGLINTLLDSIEAAIAEGASSAS